MIYIENEGALFRGPARGVPQEVWNETKGAFVPYTGSKDKPVDWGTVIDEKEARALMGAGQKEETLQAAE